MGDDTIREHRYTFPNNESDTIIVGVKVDDMVVMEYSIKGKSVKTETIFWRMWINDFRDNSIVLFIDEL